MLSLEPTDDLARPAFQTAEQCRQWLGQLQLTNLGLAQGNLHRQITELNRFPMHADERLRILEVLREPLAQLQKDFAKRLIGKLLPLTDEESLSLTALIGLWQAMLEGYLRCLQAAEAGDAHMAKQRAMLWQRCLYYARQQLAEFTHAGYEPDRQAWQRLHAIYARLEAAGLQDEHVKDAQFHGGLPARGQAIYVATLLMHRARLLGLSRSQAQLVERWLLQWQDTLRLQPRCTASKEDAPPLVVDLDGYRGLQSAAHARASASMRCLPMVPLSKQIRVKTILLQQGETPRKVELETDMSAKDCAALLGRLHQCWCEERTDTLVEMPREAASVYLCAGLEKIYSQIARKPFKAVKEKGKTSQDAQQQIATFGRVLDETGQHDLRELGFLPEEWLMEEDSLLRARLLRSSTQGDRLAANHIVSVAHNGTPLKAGAIERIEVTHSGQLYIDVHFLPGQPQAVIAQAAPHGQSPHSGSAPCLLLPAMEKLRIPASLVLPRDWFVAGRELELTLPDHNKQKVKLGISVARGADYERVSFKPA